MSKPRQLRIWRETLVAPVLTRSALVAVMVGSILNIINQGDVMLGGGLVSFPKLALTYVVPFCVSTYGAYSAVATLLSRIDNDEAVVSPSEPSDHSDRSGNE